MEKRIAVLLIVLATGMQLSLLTSGFSVITISSACLLFLLLFYKIIAIDKEKGLKLWSLLIVHAALLCSFFYFMIRWN